MYVSSWRPWSKTFFKEKLKLFETGEKIKRWNPRGDATCVLWKGPLETSDHLFFGCTYSETIWRGLAKKLIGTSYTSNWNQLLVLITDTTRDSMTLFLIQYTFQAVLYSVWRERNGRRHGEQPQAYDNRRYSKAMGIWFATRWKWWRRWKKSSKVAQKYLFFIEQWHVQKCLFVLNKFIIH